MTPLDKRFRDDKRTIIWRAVRTIFRRSDLLSGVKTWRLLDGKNDAEAIDRAMTIDECPWIRIRPGNAEVGLLTNVTNRTPLVVEIEYGVEGDNVENLINLWGCIEDSFARHADSPKEGVNVYAYLANTPGPEQGVYEPQIRNAGLSPKVVAGMLVGTGRLTLNMIKYS